MTSSVDKPADWNALDRLRAELDGAKKLPVPSEKQLSAYDLWEQYSLDRPDKGPPYATADNVVRVLTGSPEFNDGVLWYDTFRERILTTWLAPEGRAREWTDTDDACLLVHLQRSLSWHKLSSAAVSGGLAAFLRNHHRNPLMEYIDGLVWDGVERLPTFLSDAYETPQDAYHAAVGRCWLMSMIARAKRPGCQVDTIPVLEGAQGIRKSTSLEILGGEFYVSLPRGFGDVEFLQVMEGCWLGEIPDMASFRGRDLEHIKAFITIREDRYRRKYARNAITRARQLVFAATDNTGDWNDDVTGARRFWPFRCNTVNTDYLRENRNQLFAEALVRFNRGEPWWDVPMGEQVKQAEERRFGDAWEEEISHYVTHVPKRETEQTYWIPRETPLTELRMNDLLEKAVGLPIGRWNRGEQMRVAKALKALGWRRSYKESHGIRYWAYVKVL